MMIGFYRQDISTMMSTKGLKPRIENNLKLADLVTVTHERLAAKCREFNDNVIVILMLCLLGRISSLMSVPMQML